MGYVIFFVVLIDQLGGGPIQALDRPILESAPAAGTALHTLSGVLTHMGDWQVLLSLSLLGTLILFRRDQLIEAGIVPFAWFTTVAIVQGFKLLIARLRPTEVCCAFPSGHATESAMALMLLAVLLFERYERGRPWAEGVAVGLALVIGATRVILAVHWPTDVLAGWGLGWGLAGTFLLLRAYLKDQAATPWPEPAPSNATARSAKEIAP